MKGAKKRFSSLYTVNDSSFSASLLKKMLRFCIGTAADWKFVHRPDGQWSVEGIAAGRVSELIVYFEKFISPYNISFYKTSSTDLCAERLLSNQSDISFTNIPMATTSPYYHVPQPSLSGKLQFSTGYFRADEEQRGEETATALSNVHLLDVKVYLSVLSLFTSFFLFIAARILILSRRNNIRSKLSFIGREITRVIHHTSENFRLITLLCSVLLFYLVTSFLCLYKTSQIVVPRPFYPKSYQESLDHATSIAYLIDEVSHVSDSFKNAPVDSVKRKIWQKSNSSGKYNLFSPESYDLDNVGPLIDLFNQELARGSIFVASTLSSLLIKSFACGVSRENELFVLKMLSDPLEKEIIFGIPVRNNFSLTSYYQFRYRRQFENLVLDVMWARLFDLTDMAGELAATSFSHLWRQKVVCQDENAFAPVVQVHAIPVRYFNSSFKVCLCIWLVALFMHIIQCSSYCMLSRKKRRRRRTRRNPRVFYH